MLGSKSYVLVVQQLINVYLAEIKEVIGVYNIAYGQQQTINEIAQKIIRLLRSLPRESAGEEIFTNVPMILHVLIGLVGHMYLESNRNSISRIVLVC